MAEQPAESRPREPFFNTPMSMVLGAVVLWLGSIACFALANFSAYQLALPNDTLRAALMAGCAVLGVILLFMSLAMLIVGSVRWALYGSNFRGLPQRTGQHDDQVVQLLRTMNARLLLSDTAKRIAYRQEDVNALRRAIRDDMAKGDFDAAMVLVQEMSQTFGYREEGEQFREQINNARAKDQEQKINAAVANLDRIISSHNFEHAAREAAKLQRLYPESEQVKVAVRRVVQARDQYKHQLEREFLAAAERDDVDRAISLLTELDKYLTEEEAEPFRETARGVIGKRRDNLGVQFKIAVHDREWTRSVLVGEQIIRDFPNTRMADEVRGMLDLLRERAAGQQAAVAR